MILLQKETGSTCGTATLCNRTPVQQLQAEVEAYKTSPKLEIDSYETPMRWWKNHSTVYPVLAKLAKNTFACVQPVVPQNGSLVHLVI